MFFNKHYAQASVAFSRAGRKREVAICNAYVLREKARSISTAASVARAHAFIKAANAFITCARDSPPNKNNERLAYHGNAAECYSEAHDFNNAGYHYRIAKEYAAAACAYQEGGHFDEMKDVVIHHRNALKIDFLARSTTPARMYYCVVWLNSRIF